MSDLAIRNVDELARISGMMAKSKLAGDDSPADIGIKIMAGRELGMGPVAAVQNIIVVKGRPTLKAQTWASLIKRHPSYNYRVKSSTVDECSIEFHEMGEPVGVSTFTIDDAKRAGLSGDNWRKYPKAMLFARAITQGGRTYCPDVAIGGIYTPDEVDDGYEEDIEITDASDDGGRTDAPSGTDAAPSLEDLCTDEKWFLGAIATLIAEKALPDGYAATLADERQVNTLAELPVSERAQVIRELKGLSK